MNSKQSKLRIFVKHHFTDRPHYGPVSDTMLSKIEQLGFDIEAHYAFVSGLGDPFDVSVLATAEYQGKQYPIYCIDFHPEAAGERLFVLAGSHGNEEAGLLAVEEYITYLKTSANDKKLAIRIVTPHNPVGSAMFSRYNGQGFDMNRDFAKHNTLETQAVIKGFEQFKPTVAIALHEGPQEAGAFFFTNQYVKDELVQPVLTALAGHGVRLASKSYFGNTLGTPGQFPARGVFLVLMKLWKLIFKFQGFGYYCADHKVPALVMETPWTTAELDQRVGAQVVALKALTKSLNPTAA